MIELRNVTKSYRTMQGRKFVFRDLSLVIPPDRNIALIGRNGAGKSTLMNLLGGLDVPDSGRIVTDKSISWPIGLTGGFQGTMTARENVKFVARVHGAEGAEMRRVVRYVQEFAEIGEYFDQPVKSFSSGMRARVAFGLSLAFDFDYLLVDEAMSVGDAHFRDKAAKTFQEKAGKSNIILVTHGMGQVRKMCDIVLLVGDGHVRIFEDVEEGIAAYQDGSDDADGAGERWRGAVQGRGGGQDGGRPGAAASETRTGGAPQARPAAGRAGGAGPRPSGQGQRVRQVARGQGQDDIVRKPGGGGGPKKPGGRPSGPVGPKNDTPSSDNNSDQ